MIVEIGKKYTLSNWLMKELILDTREVHVIGIESQVVYVEAGKINRGIPYLVFINNAKPNLDRMFVNARVADTSPDGDRPSTPVEPSEPDSPDDDQPTGPTEPDQPVEPTEPTEPVEPPPDEPDNPYPDDYLDPNPEDNPDNPYGEEYI